MSNKHIKISLTDQFLWDLYNKFFAGVLSNADIIFTPRTTYQLSRRILYDNPVLQKYRENIGARKFSRLI